jgi:phosphatidylserine/phosphatidylglycerophosphate/cardiolipin synthase-like enzyme
MVVDRKVAIIESNNMEDNDNMEMMTHLEGPIVDSIYDTALITWGNAFKTALPSARVPATTGGLANTNEIREPLYMDRGPAREQQQVVSEGQAAQLPEHMAGDPHYDPDLASEITRMQSAYSSKSKESLLEAANRQLNIPCKKPFPPTGPEISPGEEFTPYIPISTPNPVPIALVSRPPFGAAKNSNVFVPQNEAWLSCIRNAKSSIFIQTPDLNATPLHAALLSALKRGVEVTYYVCLGYNDAGEIMPGQGGTNEMFASNLCAAISSDQERARLHIAYYVGKDQDHPIHHNFGARSCHVKLLIADGHVGIQGSGNQDTQSWYHSQEINILVDSAELCRKWREGIERNQNTARFGMAGKDGVWRDREGNEAEGSMGRPGKVTGWFKGAAGMVKKAQAKGGFG